MVAAAVLRVAALFFVVAATSEAFQKQPTLLLSKTTWSRLADANGSVDAGGDDGDVESFLAQNYPETKGLLDSNNEVLKNLREASVSGYTVFAPTSKAFQDLGEKKLAQLDDPRNLEVREKVAAYHAIPEPVTAEELFNAGGVITCGGEIPTFLIGGGMFGFLGGGDKGDGTVTINGAKLLRSFTIGKSVVHEVDALVSPKILWRYADQLRIPGSK
jgi:uncharacterized surface protein with fasciclin (FAS1) repeats